MCVLQLNFGCKLNRLNSVVTATCIFIPADSCVFQKEPLGVQQCSEPHNAHPVLLWIRLDMHVKYFKVFHWNLSTNHMDISLDDFCVENVRPVLLEFGWKMFCLLWVAFVAYFAKHEIESSVCLFPGKYPYSVRKKV